MLSTIRNTTSRRAALPGSMKVQWPAQTMVNRFHASQPSHASTTHSEGGSSTNIRETPPNSEEASEVNAMRSAEVVMGESKPTTARPVSNPEQAGEQPDHVKRSYVEKALDPADDGFGAAKDSKK